MLAWQATSRAANITYVTTTTDDSELRNDLNRGFGNVVRAIKNQPRQKRQDVNYMLIKAWMSSNKSWQDIKN